MAHLGKIILSKPDDYRVAIHIDDLIEGYLKVIEKGVWEKQVYNIGSLNMRKIDYANDIRSIVPCEIQATERIYDNRNIVMNCSDFNNEFDFKPLTDFKQSISGIHKWIKSNKVTLEELNMPLDMWIKICN
jgi:nucleoside-diphosphate-sugar epimerase